MIIVQRFSCKLNKLETWNLNLHSASQKFLESILSIQSTVEETLELLQKAKQWVERIFPHRGNALKRKSRKQKQNRRKADKRKCQRYAENEKSIKTRILNVDEETLSDEDYLIDHGDLILSAVSSIKAFEGRYLVSMLDSTSATTHSIKLMKENLSAHSLKEFDRITDTTKNNKTQELEKESESSSSCSNEEDSIESDAE